MTQQPQNKPKQVTQGAVVVKKKDLFDKFLSSFIKEDLGTVIKYVVGERIVPRIVGTVHDIARDALCDVLDISFYGKDAARTPSYSSRDNRERYATSSVAYGNRQASSGRQPSGNTYIDRFELDDIYFDDIADAKRTLDALVAAIEQYGHVPVSDLYAFIGRTKDFTYNRYGWYDLSTAKVRYLHGKWALDLPRPVVLE